MIAMHQHPAGVVLASLMVLVAPGIASAQQPAPAAAGMAARGDDSVRIGCSGGETGAGSGNAITRSGALSTYDKPLGAAPAHTPLRRDPAVAATVFRELDRLRLRTLRFNVIGNMTCVLELVDGEGRHAVAWPIRQPPPALAPVLAALARAFGNDRGMWP